MKKIKKNKRVMEKRNRKKIKKNKKLMAKIIRKKINKMEIQIKKNKN